MSEVQSDTASASKIVPSSPPPMPPVHPFFTNRPKLFAVMQLEVELAYRTLVAKDDPRLADLQAHLEAARHALTPQELDQIHDFEEGTWMFLEPYRDAYGLGLRGHAHSDLVPEGAPSPLDDQEAKRRLHQLEALLDRLEALTRLDRDLPRIDMKQTRLSANHRGDNFVLLELDEVEQGVIEVLWDARSDLTEFSELVRQICERLQQAQAPSLEDMAKALHRAHAEVGAPVPGYIAANGVLQLPKDVRQGMKLPDAVSFARCQDDTLILVPEAVMKGWLVRADEREAKEAPMETQSRTVSKSPWMRDVSRMSPDEAFRAGQEAFDAWIRPDEAAVYWRVCRAYGIACTRIAGEPVFCRVSCDAVTPATKKDYDGQHNGKPYPLTGAAEVPPFVHRLVHDVLRARAYAQAREVAYAGFQPSTDLAMEIFEALQGTVNRWEQHCTASSREENAVELEQDEPFRRLSTTPAQVGVRRSTQPTHEWCEVFGIGVDRLNELAAEGWHAPVESLERRLAADDSGTMIYVVSGLLCRVKTP